jgi:transcriptional regulator with XRE-family HTH domain
VVGREAWGGAADSVVAGGVDVSENNLGHEMVGALRAIIQGACDRHGSRRALAEAIGVHPSLLSRAINGSYLSFGADAAERFAHAFGDPEWFRNIDRSTETAKSLAIPSEGASENAAIWACVQLARRSLTPVGRQRLARALLAERPDAEDAVVRPVEGASRVHERFLALIEQLGQEHAAPLRGWQSKVAERIGMDRSQFSKYARRGSCRRDLGLAGADSVARHLGIDIAYFTTPGPASLPYRDFLLTGKAKS